MDVVQGVSFEFVGEKDFGDAFHGDESVVRFSHHGMASEMEWEKLFDVGAGRLGRRAREKQEKRVGDVRS
jgi:hypothetical protein